MEDISTCVGDSTEEDCQEFVLITGTSSVVPVSPTAVQNSSIHGTVEENISCQVTAESEASDSINEGVGSAYLPLEMEQPGSQLDPPADEEADPPINEEADPPTNEEVDAPINEEADPLINEEADPPTNQEADPLTNQEVDPPTNEADPPINDSIFQVITKFSQLHDTDFHLEEVGSSPHDSTEERIEAGETSLPVCVADEEDSLDSSGAFEQTRDIFECKLVDAYAREECECPICNLIARKPAKVSCCGQIFCHACISTQTECPMCRDVFEHCMIDKLLERKIRHQQVYCVNQDKGCEWTGELGDVPHHLRMDPINLPGIERCPYQLTTCKKCDEELLYVELSDHMDSVCEHRIVRCEYQFAGCHFKGPEMNMSQHLQENTTTHLALVSKLVKDEKCKSLKFRLLYWFTLAALVACLFALFSYQQARINDLEEASSSLVHLMQANAKQLDVNTVNLTSRVAKYIDSAVDYFIDILPWNYTQVKA